MMRKVDILVKFMLSILLINLVTLLVYCSWLSAGNPSNSNAILNSTIFVVTYFSLLVFCFFWLIKDSISCFSISLKDGIRADLKQIKKDKEEIVLVRNEIRDLAILMLESHLTIIENSKRWSGWSEGRIAEMMEKIEADCLRLQVSEVERAKIFKTKSFWDKIDRIMPLRDRINQAIKNQEQNRLLNEEWDRIVNQDQPVSADFLEKFLPHTSFDDVVKVELISAIKSLS